jgi:hypothetical protein
MQGIAQKILANPAKYSIEQLTQGVQNGVIPAYVGIPLIQEKIQQQKEAQSMSMGQQQRRPVAEQIMQEAQSAGVPALSSNLPQEYAGGGIIAFDEGGEVKRYADTGLVSTGESERRRVEEAMAKLRTYGLRQRQQDPQGYAAAEAAAKEAQDALSNIERGITGGPVGAMGRSMGFAPIPPAVAPAVAPTIETPYDPTTATRRSMYPEQTQPSTPSTAPASPADPGIAGIKMPTLQTYTPKVATLPERTMGDLVDLNAITKDMPQKTKDAFDTAVNATKTELEGFDKPGFDTREGRLKQREAGLEKDSAIGRALNLMSLGFGIAGSKERTLAGALGNEGRQGIADLIRGEAANRAAKDRLEDARDNFEQQKVAAKKGNYQAAQAAGRDASRDLLAATQFSLTGAQAGNAQAISMYSALTQRDIGAANVTNQGEQLRAAAIAEQNRNALTSTGLGLQAQQLAQTGAFQNKQLENMERRYAAMDNASRARILQVRAGAMAKFMENTAPQLNAQFVKEYGPNWRTGGDPRSLEAQMKFKQAQNAYIMDALGQYETMKDARSADDLLSQ